MRAVHFAHRRLACIDDLMKKGLRPALGRSFHHPRELVLMT